MLNRATRPPCPSCEHLAEFALLGGKYFTTLLLGRASEAGAPIQDERTSRAHACKRAHFHSDADNAVTESPSIGNQSYGII